MIVKIFTMTHKKFNEPQDPIYIPLHVGHAVSEDLGYLGDDTGASISAWNKYYGELTGVYWVWKNVQDADIIGICHYRRYFLDRDGNMMNQKQYEDILKEYDIITSDELKSEKNCRENYGEAHNMKDLLMTEEVIKEKYPEYVPYLDEALEGKSSYYGNLMVTTRNWFHAYAEWLFDIFFELEKRIDVSSYDLYHQRVFGFLSEQLLKVWIDKNHLKVYEGHVGITAEKAETVEFKLAMTQLVRLGKITEARQMFYEYLKLRPDIRLELSDIRGEIPIIEQLLYIAEQERERGISGLEGYAKELHAWIIHYRRVQECFGHFSKGEVLQTDIDYILDRNVSWVMATVMMLNDLGGKMGDALRVRQTLYEIYYKAGKEADCEGLK